jgi:hypothetical protein
MSSVLVGGLANTSWENLVILDHRRKLEEKTNIFSNHEPFKMMIHSVGSGALKL